MPDYAFLREIERLEAQQRAFQRKLELLRGPSAAMAEFWDAEERRRRRYASYQTLPSYALSMPGLSTTIAAAEAFQNAAAIIQHSDTAYHALSRAHWDAQRLYEQVAIAGLGVFQMQRSIELALPDKPWFTPLSEQLGHLSASSAAVYDAFAKVPAQSAIAPEWQLEAPGLLPYVAAQSVATLGEVAPDTTPETESLVATFETIGEGLEAKIQAVAPALVTPYRGALEVLRARGSDWPRHLGASVRTLVDGLLSALAPDRDLQSFFQNPEDQKEGGAFTRRAKLQYIFRDVASGAYAQMVENDIEMTLATFFPANAAVHEVAAALTETQGRVFLRRVQGCLATILATFEV